MNIGEAADASGVSAKMIRYYEKTGLIDPAERAASGYRVYTDRDVHTLKFIRRSRDLGFSVEQIQTLLGLWNDRGRSSAEVKAVALEHRDRLCHKVAELQAMIETLNHLAQKCSDDERPDCPILRDLEEGPQPDCGGTGETLFGIGRIG